MADKVYTNADLAKYLAPPDAPLQVAAPSSYVPKPGDPDYRGPDYVDPVVAAKQTLASIDASPLGQWYAKINAATGASDISVSTLPPVTTPDQPSAPTNALDAFLQRHETAGKALSLGGAGLVGLALGGEIPGVGTALSYAAKLGLPALGGYQGYQKNGLWGAATGAGEGYLFASAPELVGSTLGPLGKLLGLGKNIAPEVAATEEAAAAEGVPSRFGNAWRPRYASEVPGSSYREPFAPSTSSYGEAPPEPIVDRYRPNAPSTQGPIPSAPGESVFSGPSSEGLRDQPLYQQMEHVPTSGDVVDTSARVGAPVPPEVSAAQRLQPRATLTPKTGILNYAKKMGTTLNPANVIPTGETPEAVGNYADQMGHRIINIRPGAPESSAISPASLAQLKTAANAPLRDISQAARVGEGRFTYGIDTAAPKGVGPIEGTSDFPEDRIPANQLPHDLNTLSTAPRRDQFGRLIPRR